MKAKPDHEWKDPWAGAADPPADGPLHVKLRREIVSATHAFARIFFGPVLLARVFFILLTTWIGVLLSEPNLPVEFFGIFQFQRWLYSVIGFTVGFVIVVLEYATDAISSHKILLATMGAMMGLVMAHLVHGTIPPDLVDPSRSLMACNLIFGYFGMVMAIKHAERFHLSRLKFFLTPLHERPKVLDSSVIIDGRIRELIELKVVNGPVMIPNFVLGEIQAIADSNDPNSKARGRRGLEVLEGLRESCKTLELVDKDYPQVPEVDQKLVRLCRELDAELITNDYNLQKIAQLHRLTVININEIANALKPTVYIGEVLTMTIAREGKEIGQGVGYLEDGTMVVVDDAADFLGQQISVTVSSILQTSSGRLIFARPREEENAREVRA